MEIKGILWRKIEHFFNFIEGSFRASIQIRTGKRSHHFRKMICDQGYILKTQETLTTGIGKILLISMLDKLNLFYSIVRITGAICDNGLGSLYFLTQSCVLWVKLNFWSNSSWRYNSQIRSRSYSRVYSVISAVLVTPLEIRLWRRSLYGRKRIRVKMGSYTPQTLRTTIQNHPNPEK